MALSRWGSGIRASIEIEGLGWMGGFVYGANVEMDFIIIFVL